jgi:hypothetical protein
MTKIVELKKEIEESFRDVPCPGDDRIVVAHGDDCDNLINIFRGQHWIDWKSKSLEFLRKGDADQHYLMTPEAIHFFYPLYMFATLDDFNAADLFRDSAIRILISPRYIGDIGIGYGVVDKPVDKFGSSPKQLENNKNEILRNLPKFEKLIKGFSANQITAIKKFLHYLKAAYPNAIFVIKEIDMALKSIAEFRGES